MKKFFLLILTLFSFSCLNKDVKVEQLPEEKLEIISVNQNLVREIKYSNYIPIPSSLKIEITPENSELSWSPKVEKLDNGVTVKNYDYIVISGKPYNAGSIYIDLHWGIYGNHYPYLFKKRYILEVK